MKKSFEKNFTLTQALSTIKKKYGDTTIFHGDEKIAVTNSIPSGCLDLDYELGIGVPLGKIIEIYGKESSGKTVLSLIMISSFQKHGKKCVFIDGESSLTKEWAEKYNVNFSDLIYCSPDCLETALDIMYMLAETGEVSLIVYDSLASLPTRADIEKDSKDGNIASIAKVLTPALRKLTPTLAKNDCSIIFINQVREAIGQFSMYGIPEQTPGGRALKHFCSLRLNIKKESSSELKNSDVIIGHSISIQVKKNKVTTKQGVKASFTIYYNNGFDKIEDILNVGVKTGIIQMPNNKKYVYKDISEIGRDNFKKKLMNNIDIVNKIEEEILGYIKNNINVIKQTNILMNEVEDSEDIENITYENSNEIDF